MKFFANHYGNCKPTLKEILHPPSHNHHRHLARPRPLPIHMSSNQPSTYQTNSTARGHMFMASSIKIWLIIRLQPQRYTSDFCRVGLIGTILSGPAQPWFAPLVETSSTLLENFTSFIVELEATFGYERHSRSSIPSNKAHCQPLSTLQSSVRLPAMSVGMTKPYATIFVDAFETISRLFS